MRRFSPAAAFAALALMAATPALADGRGDAGPDRAAAPLHAAPLTPAPGSAPQGRDGVIPLAEDGIALNVASGWRFYSSEQAHAFLQRNNAAAPPGAVLGLLARAGDDIRQDGIWATVVSYDAIGYVQPETAAGLSESNFESDVSAARAQQNRPFEGFIAEPVFDASAPALTWSERSAAPGAGGKDLRYELRLPGRHGVVGLTSIGSADQSDQINVAALDLRGMLSFGPGARHSDFQPASDRVSAYSVPGLITGTAEPPAPQAADIGPSSGQTSFGGFSGWFPWMALGVIVLALAGYLLMRRRREPNEA